MESITMRIGRTTYRMSRPKKHTAEELKARKTKRNIAYNKANTIRLPININTRTDQDILDFLTTIPNKQGYIKSLIRSDMAARHFIRTVTDNSLGIYPEESLAEDQES